MFSISFERIHINIDSKKKSVKTFILSPHSFFLMFRFSRNFAYQFSIFSPALFFLYV